MSPPPPPPLEFSDQPVCTVVLSDGFNEWWNTLDDDVKDEGRTTLRTLARTGYRIPIKLGKPLPGHHIKNAGKVYELRFWARGGPHRCIYIFDKREAILLAGGKKGGFSEERFLRELVREADRAWQQHRAAAT